MNKYRRREGAWHEEVPSGESGRKCTRFEPVTEEATAAMLDSAASSCQGELIDVVIDGATATVRCKSGGILSVSHVTL